MTNFITKLKTVLPRWFIFALAIPLLVLDGWVILLTFNYLGTIVAVTAIASIVAFVLDYPVRALEKRGIDRGYSVLIVFLLALSVALVLGVALVPLLIRQLEELANRFPTWLEAVSQRLEIFQSLAAARGLHFNTDRLVDQLESLVPQEIQNLPDQILNFALNAADSVFEIILTVALSLYLLLHGKEFWDGILQWLPNDLSAEIRRSLKSNFQNYFIGQLTVALIQGTVLTIAFWLLKLPLFFLFGMGIGLLVLIPFFDTLGVLVVSLIVGLTNAWLGVTVLVVALLLDQLIDNAITPRILGGLVGLNPVWIILSLLLGTRIAGFLGIAIAVPIASTIRDITTDLRSSTPADSGLDWKEPAA